MRGCDQEDDPRVTSRGCDMRHCREDFAHETVMKLNAVTADRRRDKADQVQLVQVSQAWAGLMELVCERHDSFSSCLVALRGGGSYCSWSLQFLRCVFQRPTWKFHDAELEPVTPVKLLERCVEEIQTSESHFFRRRRLDWKQTGARETTAQQPSSCLSSRLGDSHLFHTALGKA